MTNEDALLRDDIYDRTPIRERGRERLMLLGDAARPMMPNMGPRACQALEDVVSSLIVMARLATLSRLFLRMNSDESIGQIR